MILAVLDRNSPPITLASRFACVGGELFIDRVPATPERANAMLAEMDELIAECAVLGGRCDALGVQIGRDRLKLEIALRHFRMWRSASGPMDQRKEMA